MDKLQQLQEFYNNFTTYIILAILWEATWKVIALWKAARNNHMVWFICIALINSFGIIPIVYILMFRKKTKGDEIPE